MYSITFNHLQQPTSIMELHREDIIQDTPHDVSKLTKNF